MEMNKKISVISNVVLMIWVFLDMIGISYDNRILVTRSYKDDGIFFIIFIIVFLWFILNDKIGKYVLSGWLLMWFALQFYFHWFFTLFGPWEGKIKYFAGTIKLIPSTKIYIPDLYHIILHILILIALISLVICCILSRKRTQAKDYENNLYLN